MARDYEAEPLSTSSSQVVREPAIVLNGVEKRYELHGSGLSRLLSVTGLRRSRGTLHQALHPASLTVTQGEVVGLVGLNGAGKSTLLKLIAGTLTPSAGQLHVNGRIVALLELGTGFHPDLSGRDNIFLNGAILGHSADQIEAVFDDIVRFSGLEAALDRPVKSYSSGMFARLAFSIATAIRPDVLIIDETLSVGDGRFARKSFERILDFRDSGATILFCSHSLYQVEAICTRVLWLDEGRIVMDGVPADVVSTYTDHLNGLQHGAGAGDALSPCFGVGDSDADDTADARRRTELAVGVGGDPAPIPPVSMAASDRRIERSRVAQARGPDTVATHDESCEAIPDELSPARIRRVTAARLQPAGGAAKRNGYASHSDPYARLDHADARHSSAGAGRQATALSTGLEAGEGRRAADGATPPVLRLQSGHDGIEIRVEIEQFSVELPPPSLGLLIMTRSGQVVSSAGTLNDAHDLSWRPRLGGGRVASLCIEFPAIELLKGRYAVSVYLLCERGIHVYDQAEWAVEFEVFQASLEQGVVRLAHRWHDGANDPDGGGDNRDPMTVCSSTPGS